MTNQGTVINFLKQIWNLSSPLGTDDIYWSEEWYNPKKIEYPQITVTPITEPEHERFKSALLTYTQKYHNLVAVNCWVKIPAGGDGTRELTQIGSLRSEVCRSFIEGIETNYGGSLSPFGVVMAKDKGVARHELKSTPRLLRYEVTLVATEHFTK